MVTGPALAILVSIAAGCSPQAPSTGPDAGVSMTFEERLQEASSEPVWVARGEMGGLIAASLRLAVPASVPADATSRASWFLGEYGAEVGVADPLSELEVTKTVEGEVGTPEEGDVVVTYRRQSRGVPVFNGEIKVEVDASGEIIALVAQVPLDVDSVDIAPTINEASAREAVLARGDMEGATVVETELMIFNEGMFEGRTTPSLLVWRVATEQPPTPLPTAITRFVDATRGEVLAFGFDEVYTGRNRRTYHARNLLNPDTVRANAILVLNEAGPVAGTTAGTDARAAHAMAGEVWNYYFTTHDRDSYDGAGADVVTYTQFAPAPCATAPGQPGVPCNGLWFENAMWFMDGMVALDFFGHEFTHGVIKTTANLTFAGMPGALHESMADAVGQFVDNGDWDLFEDTRRGTARSMEDPTTSDPPQPRHMMGYVNVPAGEMYHRFNDFGGVHVNSGIPNHAAFLMNAGGTHADSSIEVTGIGQAKTEKIMYSALVRYMTQGSTFAGARAALRLAAHKFAAAGAHGVTYEDCGSILNAYAAVGVGVPDMDNDCFDDDVDTCQMVYNPEQEAGDCMEPVCGAEPEACTMDPDCCEGLSCIIGRCADCTGKLRLTESCDPAEGEMCCGELTCSPNSAGGDSCCTTAAEPCATDADCCGEMTCGDGSCVCRTAGQSCIAGRECCGGSLCVSGMCS